MQPFQKYLGWVQRYLYAVEQGQLPAIVQTIDLAKEPFLWRTHRETYNTIAGNQLVDITTPQDRRRLYCWMWIQTGAAFPAGDDVQLSLLKDGLTFPFQTIIDVTTNATIAPLIRSAWTLPGFAGGAEMRGAPPVATGPGDVIRLIHASAAGGVAYELRGLSIDVPSYFPFPDVF